MSLRDSRKVQKNWMNKKNSKRKRKNKDMIKE